MTTKHKTGEGEVHEPHLTRGRAASKGSPSWKRKNMLMDQRKLDRARTILGVESETDAVDAALDLVVFRGEVLSGIDRLVAAGGLKGFDRD
jgi:hypothetical protein